MLETDYTVARIDDIEHGFGGVFVRVRAALGVSSFGLQVIELPPSSGDMAPEHDHLHDRQEELYLLLDGSGEMALPDRAVALDRETFVRVGPGTRRRMRSGPDGARILVVGGMPGSAYETQGNSHLGGAETFDCPTASTSMNPGGPAPQLQT